MKTIPIRGVSERFWAKVDMAGPIPEYAPELGNCWLWIGYKRAGYGQFGIGGRTVYAHRYAYEHSNGPIPDGLQIDHLCRVRHCVNTGHLEPVTGRVNVLRGFTLAAQEAKVTHCPQGHEYTSENTRVEHRRGSRHCLECNRIRCRENYRRLHANPLEATSRGLMRRREA